MNILKKIGLVLAVLVAAIAIAAGIYREELTRLMAVNTLFSEERIVGNFSNMNTMFESRPVPSGATSPPLPTQLQPLPETVTGRGLTLNVEDTLAKTKTTSLLVMRDGKIIHEEYRLGTKADDQRISWSVAKSVLSLATGVAVERGLLDLDRAVETYEPSLVGSAYEGVSVRQVLQMSSGVRFNEDYFDFWSDINRMGRVLALGGSMDEFAAQVEERDREPGVARKYVSIDTHIAAMVLRAATGKALSQWVSETLFQPLGISQGAYYVTDGEGVAFALGGLNLKTRDYARIGQLVLNNGRVGAKSVVPASWIIESIAASAPAATQADGFGYGYQWWIPDGTSGVVVARGIYGQFIWIDRKTRTVVVKTSADRAFRTDDHRAENYALMAGFAAR